MKELEKQKTNGEIVHTRKVDRLARLESMRNIVPMEYSMRSTSREHLNPMLQESQKAVLRDSNRMHESAHNGQGDAGKTGDDRKIIFVKKFLLRPLACVLWAATTLLLCRALNLGTTIFDGSHTLQLPQYIGVWGVACVPGFVFARWRAVPIMLMTAYIASLVLNGNPPADRTRRNEAQDHGRCLSAKLFEQCPSTTPFVHINDAFSLMQIEEINVALASGTLLGKYLTLVNLGTDFRKEYRRAVSLMLDGGMCNITLLPCDYSCKTCGLGENTEALQNLKIGSMDSVYLALKRNEYIVPEELIQWIDYSSSALKNIARPRNTSLSSFERCTETAKPSDRCRVRDTFPFELWIARSKVAEWLLLLLVCLQAVFPREGDRYAKISMVRIASFMIVSVTTVLLFMQMEKITAGKAKDEQVVALYTYAFSVVACASSGLYILVFEEEETYIAVKGISFLPTMMRRVIALKAKHMVHFFFAMEAIEVAMQLFGLLVAASETDAFIVLLRGECIAVNVVVLPIMIWISSRDPSLLVYVFAVEIFIDKSYLALSLAKPPATPVEHLNVLVPSMMTIVTVKGFNTMKNTARRLQRSGLIAGIMSAVGVSFGAFMLISFKSREGAASLSWEILPFAPHRDYISSTAFLERLHAHMKILRHLPRAGL